MPRPAAPRLTGPARFPGARAPGEAPLANHARRWPGGDGPCGRETVCPTPALPAAEHRRAAGGGRRTAWVWSWACVVALLAGFAQPGRAQLNNCIPPTGRGAPVGALDDLRGSVLLVAYATGGGQQGKITSGTIDLFAAPQRLRERGVLMIGSTTINLARVGGEFAGSLRSRDPGAPSVTLEAARSGVPAVLTFGSVRTLGANGEPNTPVVRFEIHERFSKGLRGRWRTVGGSAKAGSGYFCASRF